MTETNDIMKLIKLLDDKSTRIADTAWAQICRTGDFPSVAKALESGLLTRQPGIIRAFNLMAQFGYQIKPHAHVFEKYLNPKKPTILYDALFNLVCLRSIESLPTIRKLLADKSLPEKPREYLLKAEEALTKNDPKIFSAHYGAYHIWEPGYVRK
jgi:hypothetical protein